MKKTKTVEQIKDVREIIISLNKPTFRASDVLPKMAKQNIYSMVFYFFEYSGCLKKIDRGLFSVTNRINTMSDRDILKQALRVLEERKQIRAKTTPNIFTFKNKNSDIELIKTESLIKELKNRGFKIMQPVSEYVEV